MKKNTTILVIAALLSLVALILFSSFNKEQSSVLKLHAGDATLFTEIASTLSARTKGLSGRESLEEGEGMLFVFAVPDKYGFWMKEMNFPIDIIWIGEDKRIVHIKESALPKSFPEVFYPPLPALYVLETGAGFVDMHGVSVGDNTEFTPTPVLP
jgi:uncharacterized protein